VSKDKDKVKEGLAAYQAKIEAGEPIITHVIEPPFKMKVENNMVHIDAPCMVAGDMRTAAVVRISLSAAAAKAMKDAFVAMTFTESPANPGSSIQ
jgi:hypothetical protein